MAHLSIGVFALKVHRLRSPIGISEQDSGPTKKHTSEHIEHTSKAKQREMQAPP